MAAHARKPDYCVHQHARALLRKPPRAASHPDVAVWINQPKQTEKPSLKSKSHCPKSFDTFPLIWISRPRPVFDMASGTIDSADIAAVVNQVPVQNRIPDRYGWNHQFRRPIESVPVVM